MPEVVLDDSTTDDVLSSLVGKWVQKNPCEGFVDYPEPVRITRARRLETGWIKINFTGRQYMVFRQGKVVWDA